MGAVVRYSLAIIGAALVAWVIADRFSSPNHDAARRAIEARAADLTARAIESGSALACLDGLAGETVETACEKALFAHPETVAAAVSYTAARLELLSDIADYARLRDADVKTSLIVLRRSLESDRFGFVAHVLAARDGCTREGCETLSLLRDASRVRANLGTRLLDRYLQHYAAEWAKEPSPPVPVAEAAPPEPAKPKVSLHVDFPSADSIPRVSIMNPEPTGPVLPGVAAAAAANPNPPPASAAQQPRRPRKQTASPQAAGAQPVPSPPSAPAASTAGQSSVGPAVVPPVQLVPFPPPEANAGLTTRAQ
jgi:hypothetical protein